MQHSEAKQQLIECRAGGGGDGEGGLPPFLSAEGSCFHLSLAHFTR